jgi:hypothetical protein
MSTLHLTYFNLITIHKTLAHKTQVKQKISLITYYIIKYTLNVNLILRKLLKKKELVE